MNSPYKWRFATAEARISLGNPGAVVCVYYLPLSSATEKRNFSCANPCFKLVEIPKTTKNGHGKTNAELQKHREGCCSARLLNSTP
jgi:hypothetical protein